MLENEGFNLVFDKDNDMNMSVRYSNLIEDTITFDEETITKIKQLSKYHKVSIMKYFSDTLQIEMTKKLDMYIQTAFNEIINEQYTLMEDKQHDDK